VVLSWPKFFQLLGPQLILSRHKYIHRRLTTENNNNDNKSPLQAPHPPNKPYPFIPSAPNAPTCRPRSAGLVHHPGLCTPSCHLRRVELNTTACNFPDPGRRGMVRGGGGSVYRTRIGGDYEIATTKQRSETKRNRQLRSASSSLTKTIAHKGRGRSFIQGELSQAQVLLASNSKTEVQGAGI